MGHFQMHAAAVMASGQEAQITEKKQQLRLLAFVQVDTICCRLRSSLCTHIMLQIIILSPLHATTLSCDKRRNTAN